MVSRFVENVSNTGFSINILKPFFHFLVVYNDGFYRNKSGSILGVNPLSVILKYLTSFRVTVLKFRLSLFPRVWIWAIFISRFCGFIVFSFSFLLLTNVFPQTRTVCCPVPFFCFFSEINIIFVRRNNKIIFVNFFCKTVFFNIH